MKEDLILSERAGVLSAAIMCDIDHHTAKPIREQIDRMLFERKPKVLVLDFSAVGFMDSSGLGLIIGRSEKAYAVGAEIWVEGLSAPLMKLVRLSGIEKIKNISLRK